MRGLRSLVLLVVVAAGVGYFALREHRRPTTEEDKQPKVFSVDAGSIDEVTITSSSGEQTTLKKNGAEWQMISKVDYGTSAPDPDEVSAVTRNLADLQQTRVVEEKPQDLKDYGLAQPRIQVRFKSGGQERTLQIGAKTPTSSDLYAKLGGEQKVFLIPAHVESTFDRTTFDLGEKNVLKKIDPEKVDSLEVTVGKRTTRFSKVDGKWTIAAPAVERVDPFAISGLVSNIATAKMQSVARDTTPEAAGLDKPAATVRVGVGSSSATLAVGKATGESQVYARDEARPFIFTIQSSILEELKKDPGDFRQKDLFDARAFNTARIEVERGSDRWAFEKKTEKDKDGKETEKWRQVAPAQKEAATDKISSLLSAVTGARATSFVDKAPAAKPEAAVALTADGKQERVSFLKSGTDAFAVRSGVPGAAKIDAALVDEIVKAIESLR